jgi:hypothetical protein
MEYENLSGKGFRITQLDIGKTVVNNVELYGMFIGEISAFISIKGFPDWNPGSLCCITQWLHRKTSWQSS